MRIYKRKRVFHADFIVDGERYRVSLGTTDWRKAQSEASRQKRDAEEGRLSRSTTEYAKLSFKEAAARYLDSRKLELGEASYQKERHLLVKPRLLFQEKSLKELSVEDLLSFREHRSKAGVGPATINMENISGVKSSTSGLRFP